MYFWFQYGQWKSNDHWAIKKDGKNDFKCYYLWRNRLAFLCKVVSSEDSKIFIEVVNHFLNIVFNLLHEIKITDALNEKYINMKKKSSFGNVCKIERNWVCYFNVNIVHIHISEYVLWRTFILMMLLSDKINMMQMLKSITLR